MRIDEEGNMELSAEENQRLMDQLEIAPQDDQAATFTALNTDTGKTIELVFDLMAD